MKHLLQYFIFLLNLTLFIYSLFPVQAFAQDNPSAVQFHGSNVLIGQYANRQGTNSMLPKAFLRNDLQMTLTVYDIPIASRFFISTEQNGYSQSIDNLSFYIDLNALKRNKARIEAKNKAMNLKNTKAPWMLRFLSNFSRIEAGRFRPIYGDLNLKGVSVSGVNIEFTNKIVYAAFATGQLKKATEGTSILNKSYKQNLMFGKFGFGEKRRTHFYLTYMHIEDEAPKTEWDYEFGDTTLKPQSNVVFGAEFRLSFIKNKWVIDGDAGLSFLTRDTRIPITYDSVLENVPQFLLNAVKPNITTSYDVVYGMKTKLSLRTTTITAGYRLIGAGYTTLGNPNLINDRQTINGRIDQAFLNRRLTVSVFYRQFKDNLIDWKIGTTVSTSYGINARLSLRKIPYFQISYTPNKQETKGDNLNIKNNMDVISASTGYNYPIGTLKSFTSLSYFYQNADYDRDTLSTFNNTQTITLNQILNFKIPLRLNFNASYSDIKHTNFNRNVVSIVLSASHQAFKNKWKNTLGGRYLQTNGLLDQNKFSLYWNTQIRLWKGGELGLSFEENIFKDSGGLSEDYNEFIARCKLSVRW